MEKESRDRKFERTVLWAGLVGAVMILLRVLQLLTAGGIIKSKYYKNHHGS